MPWRVVESQHEVSTRKLVDSAQEQELLEQLLDDVKPPVPSASRGLHCLLFTPFRYPPLAHGSRFGARHEPSLWYGSDEQRTAFAEVAYYRLLFLEGTHATLELLTTLLTAFTVRMRTLCGVDLTVAPFDVFSAEIAAPDTYAQSQLLGRDMRAAGVELFRFPSARDVQRGSNVAAFTPEVFHAASPRQMQHWHCVASSGQVEFTRSGVARQRTTRDAERMCFPRAEFLVSGQLPSPAV
jgi:hypothetical protein